jgi:hypothetical protein
MLALGKKSARDAVSFRFATYFDATALPVPPLVFGKPWLVTDWGVFANDTLGDCVWAGAAHETMLWTAEAGTPVQFTDSNVVSDYSAETGYFPGASSTDQGTDMQEAAAYRLKTGVVDATGTRHKIDAYVALKPGNLDQLALAAFLFGAAGVGIQFPSSAYDQFDNAEPWTPVSGSSIEGGHYVPIVGRNRAGNFLCVTWGRLHAVTPAFLTTYMDEGIGFLSFERLRGNASPQGYDAATLQADLKLLQAGPPSTETATMATASSADDTAGKLLAVKTAVQKVVNTFTYMGVSVGSHITDDELTQVATAAIKAGVDFDNAQSL